MISINFEDVHGDDLQLAAKILELIKESQFIKEKFGSESSRAKNNEDFQRQLASIITKKISKNIFKMDFTPNLTFIPPKEADLETMPLEEFVLLILQLVDEAADEIFGDKE